MSRNDISDCALEHLAWNIGKGVLPQPDASQPRQEQMKARGCEIIGPNIRKKLERMPSGPGNVYGSQLESISNTRAMVISMSGTSLGQFSEGRQWSKIVRTIS